MRTTVKIVPSFGTDTAPYATFVPASIALEKVLVSNSFPHSLSTEQIPRKIWERITPELPRAPFKAPLETQSQISINEFD